MLVRSITPPPAIQDMTSITILIASPSDVAEERKLAAEVIREWNRSNAVTHGIKLEERLWELHSWPSSGTRTQAILNEQLKIVDECEFAIAIFWSRIGTYTGVELGGAVEEVKLLMDAGKEVMFYFCKRHFPYESDPDQQKAVKQFKKSLETVARIEDYVELKDFRIKLAGQLHLKMTDRLKNGHVGAPVQTVKLIDNHLLLHLYQQTLKNHLSEVNLTGSPAIKSFSVKLEDIFVSLRLSDSCRSDQDFEKRPDDDGMDGGHTFNPENVMSLVFKQHRLLLVIGDPGSGKTTLLKYYALSFMDNEHYKEFGFSEPVSVFYLPLRELKKVEDKHESLPVALVSWCVNRHLKGLSEQCFDEWLEKSSSLVLLDGLDEISHVQDRIAVCKWIDLVVKRFSNASFVVTSRSTGYRKGDGIEIVTPHVRADIMDFTQEQQTLFLQKWFKAAFLRDLPPAGKTETEWQEIQEKRSKEKSGTIIAYLNQEQNESLRILARVPLMIQIMALLWKEREFFPNSRLKLYDAALDYLLDYRDRQKNIHPLLSSEDARRVLSPVSLWMQETLGTDEADREAMHTQMQKTLDTLSQSVKAPEFCDNLVDRAGLLVKYGDQEYVFRHKTFREYLAGVQLAKKVHRTSGFLDDLVKHFGDDWWQEVLRFFIAHLDDADLFDQFMEKLFALPLTESLMPKQQEQLRTLVREAPQKKIDALKKKLLDPNTSANRKSYLKDCLIAMGRSDADEIVRRYDLANFDSKVFVSRYENDALYMPVKGGIFICSRTKSHEEVPDFYMARYPVTNKLYRRFIKYLKIGALDGKEVFSLDDYRSVLKSKSKSGFLHREDNYFKPPKITFRSSPDYVHLFRSPYDDDKRFNGEEQPVVGISWYAAKSYCLWLSLIESNGKDMNIYNLPSEIQWEYAAAGSENRLYPWGFNKPTYKLANYESNEGYTTPVNSYPEGMTPDYIFDMAGNVSEWTDFVSSPTIDFCALRGGSWRGNGDMLRCSSRITVQPGCIDSNNGFRVMRSVPDRS